MSSATISPLLASYSDAAYLLGIGEKTIRNQVSAKTFPLDVVKIGGRTLFRIADIHYFAQTGKSPATPSLRDPHTVDQVNGVADAEFAPRRGRPRKIVAVGGAQ